MGEVREEGMRQMEKKNIYVNSRSACTGEGKVPGRARQDEPYPKQVSASSWKRKGSLNNNKQLVFHYESMPIYMQ